MFLFFTMLSFKIAAFYLNHVAVCFEHDSQLTDVLYMVFFRYLLPFC